MPSLKESSKRREQGSIRAFFLRSQLLSTIFAMAALSSAFFYEMSKVTEFSASLVLRMGLWLAGATGLSIFFIKGVANRVEHMISRPIVRISRIANYIELHNDYSVRLKDQGIPLSVNEIGEISDSFDSMLEEINRKDMELEQKIVARTKELQESLTTLERTQRDLVSSSRMAALGEMSGGVAHEINNPLCVIVQSLGIVEKYFADDEVSKEMASRMLDKASRMSTRIGRIVHGLRTFARNGDNDPFEDIEVQTLVDNTMVLCEERFTSSGISLLTEIEDPKTRIRARGVQISQVLLNLLNNSFDAVSGKEGAWTKLVIKSDQDRVIFRVVDSGEGIPDTVKEKIFQPFFTTKNVGKGTGLGLSISKGIVEAHGGKIEIPEERHTTFQFSLLRREAPNAAA